MDKKLSKELKNAQTQTYEMCIEAVGGNGYLLKEVRFDELNLTKEQIYNLYLIAVRRSGCALQYIKWSELEGEFLKERTQEICFEAVKENGLALEYVTEQTEEICLEAVRQNGLALDFVEEQFSKICIEALKENGIVFRYLKKICRKVVKRSKLVLTYAVLMSPFLILVSLLFFLGFREEKEAYGLDYQLEYDIAESIETNKSVSLGNIVKEDFDKVCIYYSYSMFEPNKGEFQYFPTAKLYNKKIPKNNFSYIVFLDEDGDTVKSLVLNKKYDILGNRSYMEYSKKDSLFKFKKVKGVNEYSYELN
ncbi:DUF4116 domain-containing protein [Clostridioides difficile]|uniref:DUF4116 domain-containing protein n=1 Tax=Clostridioides difficile TaxID=1496 RepID=UPI000BCC8472|nr:DUF4116 domain-containing protein [Clostridioides difficile]PBF99804.1 hypothetical protein BGV00_06190 [Clostridioides difficile]